MVVFLYIKKMKTTYNQTFNIGGGLKNSISLKDLTKRCTDITGNRIKIKKIKKTSIFDIPYYVTDNKKIFKYYKWRPTKSVDLIVKDIYQWLINNYKLKKKFK